MDIIIKNPYLMLDYIWLSVFYSDIIMIILELSTMGSHNHPWILGVSIIVNIHWHLEGKKRNHLLDRFKVSFHHSNGDD